MKRISKGLAAVFGTLVLSLAGCGGSIYSVEQNNTSPRNAVQQRQNGRTIFERARQIQIAYWTPNPEEKGELVSREPNDLSWQERLRLLHLACLELVTEDPCKKELMSRSFEEAEASQDSTRDLISNLFQQLTSETSPFRPRPSRVKQRIIAPSHKPRDIQAPLENASITHIGSLKVIQLDDKKRPLNIAFIPFDDIRHVVFGPRSLFIYAKLSYEHKRQDEMVLVPLLYGISWMTTNASDHDGSLTRGLGCGIEVWKPFGIAVGHQDFFTEHGTLFGIGSVRQIMFALHVRDPKFEQKWRARGVDPDALRKEFSNKLH